MWGEGYGTAHPTTTAAPPTCSFRGVLCRRCWWSAFLVSSHASSVLTLGEEAWLTGSVSSDSPLNFPSNTMSWPLRGGKPRPGGGSRCTRAAQSSKPCHIAYSGWQRWESVTHVSTKHKTYKISAIKVSVPSSTLTTTSTTSPSILSLILQYELSWE